MAASSSANHLVRANDGFRQRTAPVDGTKLDDLTDLAKPDGRSSKRTDVGLRSMLRSTLGSGREGYVKEGFRRFGDHCARNQIRTLLIDCLVMTNLFYPALAVYLQKRFPPLHPPSPPSYNIHRIPAQGQAGPSRRIQKEHPLSLLSTPVLDSFFPYPPPLLPRLTWAGWWGRDTGQHGDGWRASRAASLETEIGEGGEDVKIMRVGWADVGDVLDHDVEAEHRAWAERDHILLHLVRDIAEQWETNHPLTRVSCVRELAPALSQGDKALSTGPCYVVVQHPGPDTDNITPLAYLSTPSDMAVADGSEALDSVPIGWAPNAGNVYHSVAALFRVPRSSSIAFEDSWMEAMDNLTMTVEGEVFIEAQVPQGGAGDQTGIWQLFYGTDTVSRPTSGSALPDSRSMQVPSQTPRFVVILYLFLFAILAAQISDAHKVHSRFGLAFTGIVQLCCSAVMSISVLVLLGWNGWGSSSQESTLPAYILPFVIVVVGVENMSTLTKAVFSIPFTHSVPVRIGLGLSKVGTTIALTSLTDLGLLGLIWLCVNLRPVREFCLFAAVVIITDWFMLHTFYLTVLSIDAQRLELADVLASDGASPAAIAAQKEGLRGVADYYTRRNGWRRILRARTTKSGSIVLLLITVGVLSYLSERQRSTITTTASLYGYNPTVSASAAMAAVTARASEFVTTANDLLHLSTPEKLWRTLNPLGWPFVRIVIPAASIVVLPRAGHHMLPADIRKLSLPTSRLLLPRLKPLFYLFKVVILPQAVTATSLYMLLRYLLKDSELLDAQRDRLGRGDKEHHVEEEETDVATDFPTIPQARLFASTSGLQVNMLPGSHEADIDIIASSSDGELAISIGIDNTACLWRFTTGHATVGTREILQAAVVTTGDPIISAAISSDKRWIAVCSTEGLLQIWELLDDNLPTAQDARSLARTERSSRITSITFDTYDVRLDDPLTAKLKIGQSSSRPPPVLIAFHDGEVISYGDEMGEEPVIPSSGPGSRVFFLMQEPPSQREMQIVTASHGGAVLYRKTGTTWSRVNLSASAGQDDRLACISHVTLDARDGLTPVLIAVGYRSGLIEVFDNIGKLVTAIGSSRVEGASGGIRHLSLAAPSSSRCTACGTVSKDGFFVMWSTASTVYVDRVTPTSTVFCRCGSPRRSSSMDESSRDASPVKGSLKNNSLIVPPLTTRPHPSPGNSPKRPASLLPPVPNGDFPVSSHGSRRLSTMHREGDRPSSPTPEGASLILSPSNGSAITNHAVTDMEAHPFGAVLASGGSVSWGVVRDTLIGIRRKGGGIDDSQWQLWAIDLSAPWNGSSLLVETANLSSLVRRPPGVRPVTDAGVSMRDRRAERLLSLNGRAPFPSTGASLSVPTHPSLGYVEIHPFAKLGLGSVMAGFGNRLGVISLPEKVEAEGGQGGYGGGNVAGRKFAGYAPAPPPPRRVGAFMNNTDGIGLSKKTS